MHAEYPLTEVEITMPLKPSNSCRAMAIYRFISRLRSSAILDLVHGVEWYRLGLYLLAVFIVIQYLAEIGSV